MLSFKRLVLLGLLSLATTGLADEAVPHQIYREAIDPNAPTVSAPATQPSTVPSTQPVSAAPVAPAATATPTTGSVTPAVTNGARLPATPTPPVMPSSMPSLPAAPAKPSAASNDTSIQQQIDLINQNNVIFAQTINTKIEALSNEMSALQTRLQQLSQAMLLLNQELRQKTASPSVSRSPGSVFARYTWFDYLFWFAVLALVMILLSFFRRSSKPMARPVPAARPAAAPAEKPAAPKVPPEDLEGDYDYLGSSESIPAKLNLARAYLAMGNHGDAQQVLKEVLESGDNKQRLEAEVLLKKIPTA